MFYKNERFSIFIDGMNTYAATRALGFSIDFKALCAEFARRGNLLRISYYTTLLETEEHTPIKPLVDWMTYNGFNTVTKTAKEKFDSEGNRRVKGNIHVEIAVDAFELAGSIDHVVLFSGDGDFIPLVEGLKRRGKRISVASTLRSNPQMASNALRGAADNFIELDNLRDVIGKAFKD